MIHLDLFSGIGGFAYAADQVFQDVEHIFCDSDTFCQQVLKKHWPESEIYDDIRQITADTFNQRLERQLKDEATGQHGQPDRTGQDEASRPFILTGGFPCQPFSAAGLRRGTADERHLWPEMLRVIRLTQPRWVIAENVSGILTWDDGLVFEQVCTDLEAAGYEVQPFVIPAVAVNAPHRRDRVWFVAHAVGSPDGGGTGKDGGAAEEERLPERDQVGQLGKPSEIRDVADSGRQRREPWSQQDIRPEIPSAIREDSGFSDWERDWYEVAAELCSLDDGLPAERRAKTRQQEV